MASNRIASADKLDKLVILYGMTQAGGGTSVKTLWQLILETLTECEAAVSKGRWITSTSGAGRSVAQQAMAGFDPWAAKRLAGELRRLYSDVVRSAAEAGTTLANDGSNDAVIYSAMEYELERPRNRGARSDWTWLRYGRAWTAEVTQA